MPQRTQGLLRGAFTGLLGVAALGLPAVASAATCADQPTSQAFLKWGDTADYSLAPGGNFESGGLGWKLTNAKVVLGNENLGAAPGFHSLALGAGLFSGPSGVISPPFCVGSDHPYFRYMLKPTGPVGLLATFIRYKAADGSTIQQQVTSKVSTNLYTNKWQPSDLNPLSVTLPIKAGETATVQLIFVTPMSVLGAGYYIDNILVDPYRRG